MKRKSLLTLGLALPGLALAAPQRYEMRSYMQIDGKVQPAFAWCDAPDRVLAVTRPMDALSQPQPIKLARWLKRPQPESDAATLTALYLLGPSEGAAGSVYTRLSFPDGSGANSNFYIRASNVENVLDPAYRMTRVNEFRTPESTFPCRYQPQAVFMGATVKRTVIVWDNGKTATCATRNFDGTPGVYVTGGRKRQQEETTIYEFKTVNDFTYQLKIDAPERSRHAELAVLRQGQVGQTESFLAYSISLPVKEQP